MIVIDANVVLKWTVEEPDSEQALQLLNYPLIAPDLVQADVGSVLTKKVRRREILPAHARSAFQESIALISMLPSTSLAHSALELSLRLEHAIYDCYYLAAAEAHGALLVTADRLFVEKVRACDLAPLILLLGEELPDA